MIDNPEIMKLLTDPDSPYFDQLIADGTPDVIEAACQPHPGGRALFDAICRHLRSYLKVRAPERTIPILALWAMHTHLLDELGTTPRLVVTAEIRISDGSSHNSGKSTILRHVAHMAPKCKLQAVGITESMMSKWTADGNVVVLDEVEKLFHNGKSFITGIVNDGYVAGAVREVQEKDSSGNWVPVPYPIFAGVGMAGNSPIFPPDLKSRAIDIVAVQASQGEIKPSRWAKHSPIFRELAILRGSIAIWADQVRDDVAMHYPPHDLGNRDEQIWMPLARVAMMVGHALMADVITWAHEAIVEAADQNEVPAHIRLARDLLAIWPADQDHWATKDILASLKAVDDTEYGWGNGDKPVNPKWLAEKMKIFKMRPKEWPHSRSPRGYFRSELEKQIGVLDDGTGQEPLHEDYPPHPPYPPDPPPGEDYPPHPPHPPEDDGQDDGPHFAPPTKRPFGLSTDDVKRRARDLDDEGEAC